MANFERKFIVDPEGEAKVVEEETQQKGKPEVTIGKGEKKREVLGMKEDRTFVVDEEGTAAVKGDGKKKLFVKKPDGSTEFVG